MTEAKDFILLGIKYESAKIAGVGADALENIATQLRDEVGEEWKSNPMVERGRNSVRQEHGLNGIDASDGNTTETSTPRRQKWRLFGRRS